MNKEINNQILVPMVSGVKNFYVERLIAKDRDGSDPVDESLAMNGSDEKCHNFSSILQSRTTSLIRN